MNKLKPKYTQEMIQEGMEFYERKCNSREKKNPYDRGDGHEDLCVLVGMVRTNFSLFRAFDDKTSTELEVMLNNYPELKKDIHKTIKNRKLERLLKDEK